MSTQDESGITFEISNSQKSFRLLELPPTLLGLITSKQLPNLTLKSTVPNSIEDSTQNPPSVVLCTDNQTYQVRQVQSSNSVFVLKASETVSDADAIPSPSISAIAKCTATLELIPATPSAAHFLRTSIPIYRGAESSSQNAVASGISSNTSRTALLEKAPFSSGEYDRKCKELCIFEESSQVWLPPSSVLISVWKSMLSAASLKSFNLAESFSVSALEGIIEEDGHSVAVLKAIVERLGSDHENDLMDGYAVLSKDKSVHWVGVMLLELQCSSNEGMSLSKFLQDWQDQIPEDWRQCATLEVLKGSFSEPSKGTITFSEKADEVGSSTRSSIPSKTMGKGAKNWHEKFRNPRR